MTRIRENGGITAGDLGRRMKCALSVALMAVSIAVMVEAGMILIPAIATAVAANAPAWTIVSTFYAYHGVNFLVDATHAVMGLVESLHNCFEHF